MCRQCSVWTLDTDHAADRCVYSEDTPTPTLHLLQTVMTSVTLSRSHAAPWCCVTHLDHVGVSSVCCRLLQAPSWGHRPVATAAQADTRHAGERRHQTLHSGKLEHQRRLLKADVMLSDNRKWQKRLKSNSARAEVHQLVAAGHQQYLITKIPSTEN